MKFNLENLLNQQKLIRSFLLLNKINCCEWHSVFYSLDNAIKIDLWTHCLDDS
jgi:hypothetical protein